MEFCYCVLTWELDPIDANELAKVQAKIDKRASGLYGLLNLG
jgi:hypothetical protein